MLLQFFFIHEVVVSTNFMAFFGKRWFLLSACEEQLTFFSCLELYRKKHQRKKLTSDELNCLQRLSMWAGGSDNKPPVAQII